MACAIRLARLAICDTLGFYAGEENERLSSHSTQVMRCRA